MDGWVVVLVGAVLCFAGVASTHLGVLLSGFGLAWLLSDALGAGTSTALIIGLAGALVAWVLVTLIFRTALFFIGAIVGGVIGARLYVVLEGDDRNVVVAVVFVLAIAFLCGWLANRWRLRILLGLTAVGGAGLILNGLGRAYEGLATLRFPGTTTEKVLSVLLWSGIAAAGWWTQRHVSSRALRRDREPGRRT